MYLLNNFKPRVMKKVLLSVGLIVALIFSACDKLEEAGLDVSMEMHIEGYVFDGLTETPIKGAIISGEFGSKKTDSDGFYKISGLDMGRYRFEIEAEGYMTMVITPNLQEKEEDFKGNNFNVLLQTDMFKAEEPIATQLIEVNGPTYQPVVGVPYTIELAGPYKDRFIYGKTDAKGMVVETLPDDFFTIIIDTVIGEMEYSLNSGFVSPSGLNPAYAVTTTPVGTMLLLLVSTNIVDEDGNVVNDFDKTKSVELTFNEPLDTVESEFVLYKQAGSAFEVLTTVQYSNGNKTVTISPSMGDLEGGQMYSLDFDVQMANDENSLASNVLSFFTEGEVITSLNKPTFFLLKTDINKFTSSVQVELDVDLNSGWYEVFGRYEDGEDFVKFDNGSIFFTDPVRGTININLWLNGLPNISVPAAGMFSGGNDFELMVRTYTLSNGEEIYSDFSDIKTLNDGDLAQ